MSKDEATSHAINQLGGKICLPRSKVDLVVSLINTATINRFILPTFITEVVYANGKYEHFRILYDWASWFSLIILSLASKLNHRIVKYDFTLSIKRFNLFKNYKINMSSLQILA